MSMRDAVLRHAALYRLWQAPFAARKFQPVIDHADGGSFGRILDVGCGPGTNSHFFADADYLGIDLNQDYIERARRRHNKRFVVGDAVHYPYGEEKFDSILINSFLHHLDDGEVRRILERLAGLLNGSGNIHILEPESVAGTSPARLMERLDRGRYFRSYSAWNDLFKSYFDPSAIQRFDLSLAGVPLWKMIYFKGTAKR